MLNRRKQMEEHGFDTGLYYFWPLPSKTESSLQFQSAIIGGLRKSCSSESGHPVRLIRQTKERRSDVADDRTWIVVIQDVTRRQGDCQVVTAASRSRAIPGSADAEWSALLPSSAAC